MLGTDGWLTTLIARSTGRRPGVTVWAGLAVLGGLLLLVLPPARGPALFVILLILALRWPEWALALLPFAVAFGSLVQLTWAGVHVGPTDLLLAALACSWLTRWRGVGWRLKPRLGVFGHEVRLRGLYGAVRGAHDAELALGLLAVVVAVLVHSLTDDLFVHAMELAFGLALGLLLALGTSMDAGQAEATPVSQSCVLQLSTQSCKPTIRAYHRI